MMNEGVAQSADSVGVDDELGYGPGPSNANKILIRLLQFPTKFVGGMGEEVIVSR